jgi:hypothetical protein
MNLDSNEERIWPRLRVVREFNRRIRPPQLARDLRHLHSLPRWPPCPGD